MSRNAGQSVYWFQARTPRRNGRDEDAGTGYLRYGRANRRAYGAAVTVTRTSAGCQPDAASEPRCGVTTSSSRRYSPGVVGTVKLTDASAVAPGASPIGRSAWPSALDASPDAAAPPESGTHRAVTC